VGDSRSSADGTGCGSKKNESGREAAGPLHLKSCTTGLDKIPRKTRITSQRPSKSEVKWRTQRPIGWQRDWTREGIGQVGSTSAPIMPLNLQRNEYKSTPSYQTRWEYRSAEIMSLARGNTNANGQIIGYWRLDDPLDKLTLRK